MSRNLLALVAGLLAFGLSEARADVAPVPRCGSSNDRLPCTVANAQSDGKTCKSCSLGSADYATCTTGLTRQCTESAVPDGGSLEVWCTPATDSGCRTVQGGDWPLSLVLLGLAIPIVWWQQRKRRVPRGGPP